MARRRRRRNDPVTEFALKVVDGEIFTCSFVRQVCKRHLRDLEEKKDFFFDTDDAEHAIRFFGFLRHSKGEWAGQRFELQPWQEFIIGSIFGWKKGDGTRRFRTAYIEIPRKNGKSTLAAGIGLYLMLADGEFGAEVYSAATKKDQARIVWEEAANMAASSPFLRDRVVVYRGKGNMNFPLTLSKFEPLGADADTLDGLNIHGAIIDELHAHKTRAVWDVLETATAARRQPLIFAITTAGVNQNSICFELHEYAGGILKNTISDDTFFAFISTIDDGDDWADPVSWRKANPNFGITVKEDDLKRKAEKALKLPAHQNSFKRLHLNIWTQQAQRWIDLAVWDKQAWGRAKHDTENRVDEEKLRGRPCFGGLDLSSVSDITAFILVFPYDDDPEEIDVLCRFWVPEEKLSDSSNRYRDLYRLWAQEGFLFITPGNAIDYGFIKKKSLKTPKSFPSPTSTSTAFSRRTRSPSNLKTKV